MDPPSHFPIQLTSQGSESQHIDSSHLRDSTDTQDIQYRYERIDTNKKQIRLLRLLPGRSADGFLHCQIETFDLTDKPVYQAVSYEWGPQDAAREFRVRVQDSYCAIRENLWHFLDMFRSQPDNDGLLWIDQLSINQVDGRERNHQVQLMGEIYANARRVIAWLGRTDLRPGAMLAAIESHSSYFWACADDLHDCPICRIRKPTSWASVDASTLRTGRESLDLIERSYWHRLWITQELILAKDKILYLGAQRLTPNNTIRYCALILGQIEAFRYDIKGYKASMERIKSLLERELEIFKDGATLTKLFTRFDPASLNCSEPRDLVFGFLGIASNPAQIPVDYGIPTAELFGLLLDRIVVTPDLPLALPALLFADRKAFGHELHDHLVSLGRVLGVPHRWQEWLCIKQDDLDNFDLNLGLLLNTLHLFETMGVDKAELGVYRLAHMFFAALSHQRILHWLREPSVFIWEGSADVKEEMKTLIDAMAYS